MDALELMAKIRMDSKEFDEGLDKAKKSAETAGGGIGKAFGAVAKTGGKVLAGLTKATAAAVGAAAVGVGALVTKSVEAYSNYEQLVGGVQKLYGNMGQSLEEYAATVGKSVEDVEAEYKSLETAQNMVLDNAKNAYKTAGMSANQYMEVATSFSASLIDSLGGDTVKAAEQTDVAMKAISDNFNTFGGDIGMIQGAFQGFAKQNYTMLDNLKLGYGGTKKEMERLIADANEYGKATGQASDLTIDSFSDIVTAIDLIQQKQNIAGTTAREATTTIQGSLGMLSAAWENLVTGLSDKNANLNDLMKNVVDALVGTTDEAGNHINGFLDNIIPVIETALTSIGTIVTSVVPQALKLLPTLLKSVLPDLITAALDLVNGLTTAISDNMDTVVDIVNEFAPKLITAFTEILPQIITIGGEIITALALAISSNSEEIANGVVTVMNTFVTTIITLLPTILETGLQILVALCNGIAESLPELVPTIVEVMLQIVQILLDNLPVIIDAAGQILLALTNGLIAAIPTMTSRAPQIAKSLADAITKSATVLIQVGFTLITTLVKALLQNLPQIISTGAEVTTQFAVALGQGVSQMIDVGKNLIVGLWNGILNKKQWIIDQVKSIGSSIVNAAKKMFGISSPSKVFAQIGEYCAEGLGLGWGDGIKDVNKEIDKDLHYEGEVDVKTKTTKSDTRSVKSAKAGLSESDLKRVLGEMNLTVNTYTLLDSDVINKKSYKYTIGKIGTDTKAMKVAMGIH